MAKLLNFNNDGHKNENNMKINYNKIRLFILSANCLREPYQNFENWIEIESFFQFSLIFNAFLILEILKRDNFAKLDQTK